VDIMSKGHALGHAVHDATHRMPGVPEHQEYPAGHQGITGHGRSQQNRPLEGRGARSHQSSATAHDRPPRVLVGWQHWIRGLFSRKSK
jgi:hypothetical protein